MSSGAMTSTMAGADCFSWAAISRLPAKDPWTVNSFMTYTSSGFLVWSEGAEVVTAAVFVSSVVLAAAGAAAWANAIWAAASVSRPKATGRNRWASCCLGI
jgi:hypothetical protein